MLNTLSQHQGEPSKGTLLLVDDEVNIVNSLKRVFLPLKYEVFAACSGSDGLNILEQNHIDIIISDMRMPEMDGATFLKKTAEKWPDISRILLTGYADINSAISAVNEGQIEYYLHKPWQINELEVVIQNIMEKRILREKNINLQIELIEKNKELQFLNNNLEKIVKERTIKLQKAYKAIQQTYDSVVQILSSISERRESIFKGHSKLVAKLAKLTAEAIGLSSAEIQTIYMAGLLYAIGKIGMPEAIITKVYKHLSPYERKEFEKYPLLGEAILMGFPPLENVARIVASHRELFNGRGYPNKLAGSAVSVGARILSIIVDYVELQVGLIVPRKLAPQQALQMLRDNDGQRYDLAIVEIFASVIEQLPDMQNKIKERILSARALKPGMVLSQDLITDRGLKLLSQGHVLNEQAILTLSQIGDMMIHVQVK
ncbi:HD domain-containing phosphohydrolase [Legionella fallonii]|uniref:Response regulator receiver:Metal-dependent phosphohydrolase, HD subdomain n=1 Tax=Legionella fallonii LLAP-10 TaxID=1212491 RepID=A0A098G6A3_9GAMM|nr:HD domain-containing phosphohydrolase [Legionella fallonii]CEG57982.1 Response regulator receiver:Metal-dependent phosphohydrolase, HD subdomain [Legionella fallonii LLAP-10]